MDQLGNVDIYLRFIIALGLVIALITFAAWVARFLGFNVPRLQGKRQKRLAIVDALPIDSKRRLILVSCDHVEHLICVGGTTDYVVEKKIKSPFPQMTQEDFEKVSLLKNSKISSQ